MPTNSLSDAKCKAARLVDTSFKLFDGGGFLWVSSKSAKVWRMAYRLAGKQQTISFGPYPNVSLAEAGAKRDGLKAQLQESADPMAPRKANRAALNFKDAVL